MSDDTHKWCFETVHDLGVQLSDSREAVERLAEFASEMASDREAFNEGMKANCKTAFEFLGELEDLQQRPPLKEGQRWCEPEGRDKGCSMAGKPHTHLAEQGDSGEVAMWRGLCHSRAVQLNEAYDEIAKLRTEVDELHQMIDDIDDEE